jgi:hypothetical protein
VLANRRRRGEVVFAAMSRPRRVVRWRTVLNEKFEGERERERVTDEVDRTNKDEN